MTITRTWAELRNMYRNRPAQLLWVQRDTRWDVYPQREPVQLATHNAEGFWFPQPDGTWYKSSQSYLIVGHASAADLRGDWVHESITERCKLWAYHRAAEPVAA
jgi:hypothetical protein